MTHAYCEEHRADPDCNLPPLPLMMSPDELVWIPDGSAEDYEPHVIAMGRELKACRAARR